MKQTSLFSFSLLIPTSYIEFLYVDLIVKTESFIFCFNILSNTLALLSPAFSK